MIRLEKKTEEKEELNLSPDLTLVRDSLEYYDNNYEIYNTKLDKAYYAELKINSNDFQQNEIIFFDKDDKQLYTSKFEYIGIYQPKIELWSWAWALPFMKKKGINIIKKIFNYGTELDPVSHFLKSELITSRFRINHKIQLDLHCAIASFLAKKPVIFKIPFVYVQGTYQTSSPRFKLKDEYLLNSDELIYYYVYLLDYDQFLNK